MNQPRAFSGEPRTKTRLSAKEEREYVRALAHVVRLAPSIPVPVHEMIDLVESIGVLGFLFAPLIDGAVARWEKVDTESDDEQFSDYALAKLTGDSRLVNNPSLQVLRAQITSLFDAFITRGEDEEYLRAQYIRLCRLAVESALEVVS